MSDEPQRKLVRVEEVEALISHLPAVMGTRVVVDDWGAVQEIHVLATNERMPKAIVRDILSSLAARWGLMIDHKKVSVAQVARLPKKPAPHRLLIRNIELRKDIAHNRISVSVALAEAPTDADENPDTGLLNRNYLEKAAYWQEEVSGPDVSGQGVRLAAQATVACLNRMLLESHHFNLEGLKVTDVGHQPVLVTVVSLITPREPELMSGAVVIYGDELDAAVRAVLAATNRRLGWYIDKEKRAPNRTPGADEEEEPLFPPKRNGKVRKQEAAGLDEGTKNSTGEAARAPAQATAGAAGGEAASADAREAAEGVTAGGAGEKPPAARAEGKTGGKKS